MKEYKIQLYKMEFDSFEDSSLGYYYGWKNFIPRYYFKTFKSLSDLAKYIVENRLFWSKQYDHIRAQLSRRERHILVQKIWAMFKNIQANEYL